MNICVFCSSSNIVDDIYFEMAGELGQYIGENGHTLVYGGANIGLMDQLAESVKKAGGKVIGVIPQKIHDNDLSANQLDELIITQTMSERKTVMHQKSDAFIALPGGFGTLEEILEVITLKQLDYHQKPIVFINVNGFFNHLLKQFELSYTDGFAKENYRRLYKVVPEPSEAQEYIESYQHTCLGTKWHHIPKKKR